MQSDGLNSALSPVVYGDIVLSINYNYKYRPVAHCIVKQNYFQVLTVQ